MRIAKPTAPFLTILKDELCFTISATSHNPPITSHYILPPQTPTITDYLKGNECFTKELFEFGNRYIVSAGENKGVQHDTKLLSPSDLSRLYQSSQS